MIGPGVTWSEIIRSDWLIGFSAVTEQLTVSAAVDLNTPGQRRDPGEPQAGCQTVLVRAAGPQRISENRSDNLIQISAENLGLAALVLPGLTSLLLLNWIKRGECGLPASGVTVDTQE